MVREETNNNCNFESSSEGGYTPALIQSYLSGRWFVSTMYRQSSAMIEPPANWYFETIVWEWDSKTKQRGKMVSVDDSGSSQEQAMMSHINICGELLGV